MGSVPFPWQARRQVMSTSVLFIQGAGPGAHAADQALADELQRVLGSDFRVLFPLMPDEDDPHPQAWKHVIAVEAQRSGAEVLVAHSAGAAMLADLLAQGRSERDLPDVQAVMLLAPPYVGDGGWNLGGFHLDARRGNPPALPLALSFFFGDADDTVPAAHASLYYRVFPQAAFQRLPDCGHQFEGHIADVATDLLAALAASGG